jgi:alpha-N-acetylglucosaminidase
MKTKAAIIFFALIAINYHTMASSFKGVEAMAVRVAPWMKNKINTYSIQKTEKDRFEIEVKGGKLYLGATSPSAAACGFNHYLNHYCHQSVARGADNITSLAKLPEIGTKVSIETPYQYRFALNYCTFSYTMAFYGWKEWEKELDWMALHGVNLMYALVGHEIIWQKTLQQFGYSDTEIKAFLASSAYVAWWLMGNLEGFGGPLTDNMIQKQMQLQKKILARMRELGIEPVLHGFYGMVPTNLQTKYPAANIIKQGKWAGDFIRPDILSPQDTLFDSMAKAYYQNIKNIYGTEFKYFGGDPFHEGGNSGNLDVSLSAKSIQFSMQKAFPSSNWVLMGWGGNPRKDLLAGLNKSHAIVLNLFGENKLDWDGNDYRHWKLTNGYYQTPWIWCSISNFGEKTGIYGKLDQIIQEPHLAFATPEGKYMKGIGIMPEGIDNNPLLYDLALKTAWGKPISTDEHLRQYAKYRYGKEDMNIYNGLLLLKNSAYQSNSSFQEGCTESLFAARPSREIKSVSTWGSRKLRYSHDTLIMALKAYLLAKANFSSSATYKYDITEITKQCLANEGQFAYDSLMKAVKMKDKPNYEKYKQRFLDLINLQEELVATNSNFLLGKWIEQAKRTGSTPYEKQLAERSARMQITIWGPDTNPTTNLHEYAHKEWSGIIKDLYIPRWKLFFEQLDNEMADKPSKKIDFFSLEMSWCNEKKTYSVVPTGNLHQVIEKVILMLSKY